MNYYNLTIPEKGMWDLQMFYPETGITNNCGIYFSGVKMPYEISNQTMNMFIRNHEEVRARFKYNNGTLVKYHVPYEFEYLQHIEFNTKDDLVEYAKEIAGIPFNMVDSKMYQFFVADLPEETCIIALLNHMIADGWSFALLARATSTYSKLLRDGLPVPKDSFSYSHYLEREQKYLGSNKYKKDEEYWRTQYEKRPEACSLKPQKNAAEKPDGKRYSFQIVGDLYDKINCSNYSPAVIFEAAFALYLSAINNKVDTITLGMPVLNRSGYKEKQTFGMFITTSLLRIHVDWDERVKNLLKAVAADQMNLFRHVNYPYEEIQKIVRERHNYSGRLYDVLVSYQNAKSDADGDTIWVGNGYTEIPLAFHIDDRDSAGCLTINTDYQTSLFTECEICLLMERIVYIVDQIVRNMNLYISDIDIIPNNEKELLLSTFNDTYLPYQRDKCVQTVFSDVVSRHPERIALIFHNQKYTYRDLDQMSNSLARNLRDSGVQSNEVVPIIANRSWQMIVAILGVIKAGGAYLNIDKNYPAERIKYMLSIVNAKKVLILGYKEKLDVEAIDLEQFDYYGDTREVPCLNTSSDMCYLVFTSGSTGKPKGLMITHYNLLNYCNMDWKNVRGGIITEDNFRIVATTTTSFDMCITETIFPLLIGGTICLADDEEIVSQMKLSYLIEKYEVEYMQATPTKMRIYISDKENLKYLKKLKAIILGGESFSIELFHELREYTDARIYNNYGPAETTVWSTFTEVIDDDITVGRPIANTQVYILDQSQKVLPIGVSGEIYISGEGVGKGYIHREKLTKERYLPNPYALLYPTHGNVMYRTGDIGVWRENGEIEHLGRVDDQIKIRGLRVELGEIENVIFKYPKINNAAVALKETDSGRQQLVGYYCSDDIIDERELRVLLEQNLPRYMVPHCFVKLEIMPMTTSGKISRKDLPTPHIKDSIEDYVEPTNDLQRKLAELLSEILEVKRIGITDDFFHLGGDSLKAIEFVTRAEMNGVKIPLQKIFTHPTIKKLENYLLEEESVAVKYDINQFEKYKLILDENQIPNGYSEISAYHKKNGRNELVGDHKMEFVLLTGATGFLGCHILKELLDCEIKLVYCIIRDEAGLNCAKIRLEQVFDYYFGKGAYQKYNCRVRIINANLFEDDLVEKLEECILDRIDTIIHAAALVKHYGLYQTFFNANVRPTDLLLDYAKRCNARFIYISTISISGNGFADTFDRYEIEQQKSFRENDIYIGQPLDNVYTRSKFEAECHVLDAILEGIDAHIIRVGNLTNRHNDYVFQPNYKSNSFLQRLRALLELQAIPKYALDYYVEFSYVDETARGIIKLTKAATKQTVFHLYNSNHLCFDDFLTYLGKLNIKMSILSSDDFIAELKKTTSNQNRIYIYNALQNDFNSEGKLDYIGKISVYNDFTMWYLNLVEFQWSKVDFDYVQGYLNYFRKLEFLHI